ncbi:MAG: hypothetical protein ABL949_04750 [Fimbriimonadaceae bacterium]
MIVLPIAFLLAQADPDLDKAVLNLYSVISGPAEKKRDWVAFRGMFAEGAQMRVIGKSRVVMLTPEDYVARSGPFLEKNGFFEKEVSRKSWVYGPMAQVWSTYESRKTESDEKPFARGINTLTLAKTADGWKIVSISWTDEATAGPIPKDFGG